MLGLHGLMLWAGTQRSLEDARAAQDRFNAEPQLLAGPYSTKGDEPTDPFMRCGDVAVIPIKGSLVNIDSPILAYYGIASYPCIRRALVAAATDPAIKQILLDVDSGGGRVSGAQDTYDLITRVNKQVKPVTTFAGGAMCSAAYWLGCASSDIACSSTSTVGSIGILMVHIEYSKQMEKEGVTATVLRSAKFKALVNPFEPLTTTAKEQATAEMDEVHRVFTQNVADALGVTYNAVENKMGQGRTFVGAQAVDIGLADTVSTFDGVLSKLQSKKAVDSRTAIYDNGIVKGVKTMKKADTLTEQQIAALAAGATPEALAAAQLAADVAAAAAGEKTPEELAAQKLLDDKAAADKLAADKLAADTAAAALLAKTKGDTPASNELVTFLQTQNKELTAAVLEAQIALKAATDKVATVEATHTGLLDIAKTSIGRMQVALGGTAADLATHSAVAVLEEHKRVTATFAAKFQVGGVAAVSAEVKTPKSTVVDTSHQARIAATRAASK